MKNTVLLVSTNLFFFPRIKTAAQKFDLVTKMVTNINDLYNSEKNDNIQFILIDLEFEFDIWSQILKTVKTKGIHCKSIIAFGPHTDISSFEKAKNLGCTLVLPKGTFSNKLPELFNQ